MRLMIKQRVFAWTDTYDIYDEYGNPKYFVKTEFFNIGHHMHIYDMYDQEIETDFLSAREIIWRNLRL